MMYSAAMVKVTSTDGSVEIVCDEGSSVRNVRVNGKRIDIGRPGFWDGPAGRIIVYSLMLLFCLAFWAGVIVLGCKVAHASPLDCESIKSADQRHYCRAVSIPSKAECELIKEAACGCRPD